MLSTDNGREDYPMRAVKNAEYLELTVFPASPPPALVRFHTHRNQEGSGLAGGGFFQEVFGQASHQVVQAQWDRSNEGFVGVAAALWNRSFTSPTVQRLKGARSGAFRPLRACA